MEGPTTETYIDLHSDFEGQSFKVLVFARERLPPWVVPYPMVFWGDLVYGSMCTLAIRESTTGWWFQPL